jgi:hypothetical protein
LKIKQKSPKQSYLVLLCSCCRWRHFAILILTSYHSRGEWSDLKRSCSSHI